MQFLCKTKRKSNLGPIMFYLGIFTLELEKTIVISEIQHPQICRNAKIHAKQKFFKFGTENALFGYFWVVILKDWQQMGNQHSQFCQNAKFRAKIKIFKFWTKNALFGYFQVEIRKKTFIIIENSIFEFLKAQRVTQKQKS